MLSFPVTLEEFYREMNKDYFSSIIPFRAFAIGALITEMCYHLLFFPCKNKIKYTSSLELTYENSTNFVD